MNRRLAIATLHALAYACVAAGVTALAYLCLLALADGQVAAINSTEGLVASVVFILSPFAALGCLTAAERIEYRVWPRR